MATAHLSAHIPSHSNALVKEARATVAPILQKIRDFASEIDARGATPPPPRIPMLIGEAWEGEGEEAGAEALMDIDDPESGAIIARVPRATRHDAARALAAAEAGARRSAALSPGDRAAILARAAALVVERREALAQVIAREGVKTIREARREAERCAETLRLSAEEAVRLVGESIAFGQSPRHADRTGYTLYEPVGIVLALTPFNDPLNLVAHKLGPAIAAGNAIILKPHEATPLSAILLAEILLEAGLPKGILQLLTGDGREIGDTLVADPRVRMVSFTGGRRAGEHIARHAGAKHLALELGGNCPTIIMHDADLDKAVEACVSGAFWAAGQNCLHVQRLLIHSDVYSRFRDALVARTRAYRLGAKRDEATDMGCLIDLANAARIEKLVADAVACGASLATGGTRGGTRFAPTLVENLPQNHPLMREEVFGPVTMLSRFDTLDQAIAMANSVDYGLQAGIFTASLASAAKAVSALEVGAVIVNDSSDFRIDSMPFGGIKGSGIGREGVRHAMLSMSEVKLVCFRHLGGAI